MLRQYFGFADFKPGQREVIGHLLAGKSAAAVFPTGGGKSLCYQLPALVLPGLTLVVSPLIALMKDQIDALAARGIAARRLDSTLDLDEYRTAMDEVRSGRLRLLYVAPERFVNERFCETIQRTAISLFAVDEAHCISEWGHNFRPDYLRLARFAQLCRAQRVLALTATATPQVLGDICRFFRIEPGCAIRTGFYRPNLALLGTPVSAAQRDEQFFAALAQREPGPTIVYVTLQRTAEELAQRLVKTGLAARPYHAGMEDDQRRETQEWFIQAQQGIVVATIAFGMGIDKANIRYVYHYNPAKSLENYAQEVGRAGRDGKPATCEMFFCPDDLNVLENFAYGDTPTQPAVAALVDEVFRQGDDFDVSIYDLSGAHDIRNTVVRTLLTYLELLGHIDAGTPFYAEYQFKPLVSSAEILRHFEGERKDVPAEGPGPGPQGPNLVPHRFGPGRPGDRGAARPRRAGVGLPGREEVAGTEDRRRAAALSHAQQAERSAGTGQVALRPRAATGNSRDPAAPPGCPMGRAGRLPGGGLGGPFRRPDGSALRPLLLVPAGRQAGEVARRGRRPRSIRPSGRRWAVFAASTARNSATRDRWPVFSAA